MVAKKLTSIDESKVNSVDKLFLNECAKEDEFKAIGDDLSFIDNFTNEVSTDDDHDDESEDYA